MTTSSLPLIDLPSVVSSRPGENASAALATMTAALESPIGLSGIRRLSRGVRVDQLESFLGLAGLNGLRAWAMEGGYEDLASVELPLVLVLRRSRTGADSQKRRFAVLHRVDAHQALIADPRNGLIQISRAELEETWTGDVVALERDPAAEQEALEEIQRRRDPRPRMLWAGAVIVIGVSTVWHALVDLGRAFPVLALALALAASLWSSLGTRSCRACDQASRHIGGLPVAEIGSVFYFALWVACLIAPIQAATLLALAVALGIHGALVRVLVRHRLVCSPCLLTASAALVAVGSAFALHPPSIQVAIASAGAAITAFAVGVYGLSSARRVFAWRRRAAAFDLARATAKEAQDREPSAGTVRMVVYKRPGCAACAIFDATVRPGLEETFGEHLSIESRRPEDPATPTPLVVVSGGVKSQAIDVQEHEQPFDVLSRAVAKALRIPSETDPGFVWVG